jgi:Type II CAAX prenyl endopeptidase Rce1-like
MKTLTLIPEASSYGVAILVVAGLGCFALAAHVHGRWLAARGVGFMATHNGILLLVVAWGSLVFDPRQLVGGSAGPLILAPPLGLAAGWAALRLDRAVNRHMLRRRLFAEGGPGEGRRGPARGGADVRVRPVSLAIRGLSAQKRTVGMAKMKTDLGPPEGRRFGLGNVVVAGALEEVLFRGYLVKACGLLPDPFTALAALTATVLVFALSHIIFGWAQVLAKAPLGALALVTVLLSGTVLAAVIAHVAFNFQTWKEYRIQPVLLDRKGDAPRMLT